MLEMGFEAFMCSNHSSRLLCVLESWFEALWVCSNRGLRLLVP